MILYPWKYSVNRILGIYVVNIFAPWGLRFAKGVWHLFELFWGCKLIEHPAILNQS